MDEAEIPRMIRVWDWFKLLQLSFSPVSTQMPWCFPAGFSSGHFCKSSSPSLDMAWSTTCFSACFQSFDWSWTLRSTQKHLSSTLSSHSVPLALVVEANIAAGLQRCSAVSCEVGACLRGSAFFSYSLAWPGACCCCTTPLHSHGTKAALNSASRSWSWASAMSKLSTQRTRSLYGHLTPQWLDTVRLRVFTVGWFDLCSECLFWFV